MTFLISIESKRSIKWRVKQRQHDQISTCIWRSYVHGRCLKNQLITYLFLLLCIQAHNFGIAACKEHPCTVLSNLTLGVWGLDVVWNCWWRTTDMDDGQTTDAWCSKHCSGELKDTKNQKRKLRKCAMFKLYLYLSLRYQAVYLYFLRLLQQVCLAVDN